MTSSQGRGPLSPAVKFYTAQPSVQIPSSNAMAVSSQQSVMVPGPARNMPGSGYPAPVTGGGVGAKRPTQVQASLQPAGVTPGLQTRPQQPPQPPKKKRRLGDRVIPPEIVDMVPEYHAFTSFVALEKKLDEIITRKQLEIQEALKRPQKVKRRLRIYVSHTFYSGKAPESDNDEGQMPHWELRVEGGLIDDDPPRPGQPAKRRFSTFFKSLVIELDKEVYGPDNHLVEWHRNPNETDGFQVKRLGDRSVKCTILLLMDHTPMKSKLDPRLARLLGIHTETRPKIVEALWEYIKKHKLQDAHERDYINCDKYLEQTFQCQRMRFMEIPQRLNSLLLPPDPIVIQHLIVCNPDSTEPKKTACYDVDVEVDDPVKFRMGQFLNALQNQNDIINFDNKICDHIEQINLMKLHRDFFLGFSQDPKGFIEKWIISQSKDLKILTDSSDQPEEERRAEYYQQPWVQEAVSRYFYSRIQQRRGEIEQVLGIRTG